VERPVLWGAVFVVRSLPLARLLLDAGANPSDGVTLPLAASAGDVAALDRLLAYGADVNRPWATDGSAPLYAILHWSRTADGVRWLLAHGADPDPVFAANGETPLHVVAASWDAALAEQLVNRGADATRPRADGRTPYAVAELHANRDVAAWLLAHGASTELSAVDQLVAACSRGDGSAAAAILARWPHLRNEIGPEHYAAFYRAAERNDIAALEAMLACGFDPNRGDESIGKTTLHVAAMEGWPQAVRLLLVHGASRVRRATAHLGRRGGAIAAGGPGPCSGGPAAARRRLAGRMADGRGACGGDHRDRERLEGRPVTSVRRRVACPRTPAASVVIPRCSRGHGFSPAHAARAGLKTCPTLTAIRPGAPRSDRPVWLAVPGDTRRPVPRRQAPRD
jgi:ankyrin repeat protein